MLWRPKRLTGGNVDNQQIRKQNAQVLGALFHPGLLGDFVANHNHRLVTALRTGIAHVLNGLPFGSFAYNEDLNIVITEGEDLFVQA